MNSKDVSEKASVSNAASDSAGDSIPVADVRSSRSSFGDLLTGSYMWLVTIACLAVAIGVAWWSTPQQGIAININFPEGHGLQADDAVRFRGIDVGVVEEVRLNRELSGVDVKVNLHPFAEPLARSGTRFWIVRPELSLGGVSGLETAVGHKYIGLIPGDPEGEWQSTFTGVPDAPADALKNPGVEIVLRGQKRHSVTVGSPVSYRGVVAGRILSVDLSQDGRYVDVRARIFDKFTKLVTSKTMFWPTSGIDVTGSFTQGVNFEMESLETLARGGVAMLTIADGGSPIKPGDDFVLYPTAEDDWYEKARLVHATDAKYRRGAIPMEIIYTRNGFISDSEKQIGFVGVHLNVDGQAKVLVPSDMLDLPKKGVEGTLRVGLVGAENSRIVPGASTEKTTILDLPGLAQSVAQKGFSPSDLRDPAQAESCLAIRAIGELDGLSYMHYPIELQDIKDDWEIVNFSGDRDVWHGAPVLSEKDGRLVGILIVESKKVWVEKLSGF